MKKKKVMFISSTGGHLDELLQLSSMFKKYDYHIVTEKTKSKSFSNLKQDATEGACKNVANAIQPLQKLTLIGLNRVDYSEIEL